MTEDEIKIAENIDDVISQYLLVRNKERDSSFWEDEEKVYHVSSGAGCTRKAYYKRTINKPLTANTLRYFILGERIEDLIEKCMSRFCRTIDNSIRLRAEVNDWILTGETDIVKKKDGEVIQMYEIKSTSYIKYRKNEPKLAHMLQVTGYMKMLGLDHCYIIYVDKKNLDTVVHKVEFSKELFKTFITNIKILHDSLMNNHLPDKNPESSSECRYMCNYSEECKKKLNPDKKL